MTPLEQGDKRANVVVCPSSPEQKPCEWPFHQTNKAGTGSISRPISSELSSVTPARGHQARRDSLDWQQNSGDSTSDRKSHFQTPPHQLGFNAITL